MAGFDEIVGALHSAGEDDNAWPTVLADLADYLGSIEATLGGGTPGALPQMVAPRTDPREVARYFDTYHQHNTLMRDMMTGTPGRIMIDEAMDSFGAFQRGLFYNEWCVPQHYRRGFGVTIATAGGWRGALMVNSTGPIETEQVARFEAVLPHLTKAIEINRLLGQFRGLVRASLDVLELSGQGALLLDARGVLIDCNGSAAALMETGHLHLRQGRISCRDPAADRQFSRLVALSLVAPDKTAGGRMTLPTVDGPIALHVAPYPGGLIYPAGRRPAILVMISDPQRKLRQRLAALKQHHGLTGAEAELLLSLVATGSRKAAAAGRGVSDATARAQLTSIFDKTGVRRQTDLIRLLLAEE